ncbi:MAG: hypothetical protein ACRDTE_13325, partial [Pseudonocardiaceae bacterium]
EKVMGEYAAWYLDGLAALASHPQRAVPTVSRLTGRVPMSYEQWARQHPRRAQHARRPLGRTERSISSPSGVEPRWPGTSAGEGARCQDCMAELGRQRTGAAKSAMLAGLPRSPPDPSTPSG